MSTNSGVAREVALPVSVFEALRTEIEKDAGTLQTVRALHHAGYTAGLAAAGNVNREAGGDAFTLSSPGFWTHISDYFKKRGWGALEHRSLHPGIGLLTSQDWAEAVPGSGGENAGCGMSSGLLSGLLSQLAGGAVAVLEVRCRSRGDGSCDFAFGSETAIHDLYGQLLDGNDLDRALEGL